MWTVPLQLFDIQRHLSALFRWHRCKGLMLRAILNLAAAAAACIFVAAAAQAPPRTITAYSDRALTLSTGKYVHDITWSGRDGLLIATELGVYSVNASGGALKQVINNVALPDGLPDPTALSSDGQAVSAISWNSNGGF